MAIQVEKQKNKPTNLSAVFIIIFIIITAIVFFSFKKSTVFDGVKVDITKVINKDTKELEYVGRNLDQDIDAIINNPKFYQLVPHNDISSDFEVGKTNPFQSF